MLNRAHHGVSHATTYKDRKLAEVCLSVYQSISSGGPHLPSVPRLSCFFELTCGCDAHQYDDMELLTFTD